MIAIHGAAPVIGILVAITAVLVAIGFGIDLIHHHHFDVVAGVVVEKKYRAAYTSREPNWVYGKSAYIFMHDVYHPAVYNLYVRGQTRSGRTRVAKKYVNEYAYQLYRQGQSYSG